MPSYDYECKSCGHRFELFQSMSDEPVKICPACGGPVRRLIGGGLGVIFKGSGFYVTDNRGSSARGSADRFAKKDEPTGGSDASSGTKTSTGGKSETGGSQTAGSPTATTKGDGVKAST